MKNVATRMSLLIAVVCLCGCAATRGPKNETPPENVTISCVVPVLEPVQGYPWEQTKDAVSITLTPTPFEHKVVYERTLEEKHEMLRIGDAVKYKVTERPYEYAVEPDFLRLHLYVVNNLSHVLRFHGAVLSLEADGKGLPIDAQSMAELSRAVLTPYASFEVDLAGPSVQSLETAGTVRFAIHDVITEVDEANNPTKRTTYEWIFSVRPQNIRESLPVTVREQKMTPSQAVSMPRYFSRE